MEDLKQKLQRLLDAGELGEEDQQWLLNYLDASDPAELKQIMLDRFHAQLKEGRPIQNGRAKKMLRTIHERIGVRPSRLIRLLPKLAAACAISFVVLGSLYRWQHRLPGREVLSQEFKKPDSLQQKDMPPGSNKAFLTLGDGSRIALDDARNGNLAQQGGAQVLKFNGQLAYRPASSGDSVVFNSVSTPRGGQYSIVLPDGSQVWLNAASSIRFPTAFKGHERRVEVTGETYFEVAKNPARPFVVQVNGSEIKVLGTHFNVMAYADERVLKTTLLEGSVEFTHGGTASILRPGQQLRLKENGQSTVASNIDAEDVMAWKNGLFHFEGTDISVVMRQLSRWYNVDVVYTDMNLHERFHADIPRTASLAEALRALELTEKVKFEINERTVRVRHT